MVLTVLAWAYAAGVALTFLAFVLPAFLDWEDYGATDALKCLAFALCVAAVWPAAALLVAAAAALTAYYARKEDDDD